MSSNGNGTKEANLRAKFSRLRGKIFTRNEKHQDLCQKPYCRVLAKFKYPSKGQGGGIGAAFEKFLVDQYPDQRDFLVGTIADIEAQQETCSFCHFVYSRIVARGFDNLPRSTLCFADTPGSSEEIWLQLRDGDGTFVGGLLGSGERVLFVADSHNLSPRAGNIVGNKEIEYARVRSWLRLCEEKHQATCPMPPASKDRRLEAGIPALLRVFDITRNCLTKISWEEQYVALSYVWGDAVPPRLLSKNLEHFEHAQSLTETRKHMPQTIRDAMHFVTRIGCRYFWFDSLCLIQDNPVALQKGINMMDIIYESAYLTIIAATGPGADDGLPGVGNTPRRLSQQVVSIKPGLSLIMVKSLDKHLNDSVWATRGWTLQEHYLSRRTVVFVNDQAYFRCRKRIWSEETWSDIDPGFQSSEEWTTNLVALMAEVMDEDEFAPYDYLVTALQRFQQRILKYESDALNAMAGILQRVGSLGRTTLLQGLPIMVFPLMLMFLHLGPQPNGAVSRRPGFPTWSWAGWKGVPNWYALNALDLYRHPEDFLEWPNAKTWIFWFASRHGHAPKMLWTPGDALVRSDQSTRNRLLKANYHNEFKEFGLDMSIKTPSSTQPSRSYDLLAFFTIAIYLEIRLAESVLLGHNPKGSKIFSAYGIDGTLCGYLYPDADIPPYNANERFELILIAECQKVQFPIRTMTNKDDGDPRRQYWVMLVVCMEDGVFERRAIGQVLHETLDRSYQPGPVWKEITLG